MAGRNKSWGPRHGVRTRILLAIFLILASPLVIDTFENVHGAIASSEITCPPQPVCIMPRSGAGITFNTKFGQVVPLHNMAFQAVYVNANGSIYFDLRGLVPNVLNILRFTLQSYGNGTFDVRFIGPPIVTADCQGCPIDPHLSTNLPQGSGGELFFSGNMLSGLTLTVNYVAFGGACIPVCVGGSSFLAGVLFFGVAALIGVFLVFSLAKNRKREKPVYEMRIGHDIS